MFYVFVFAVFAFALSLYYHNFMLYDTSSTTTKTSHSNTKYSLSMPLNLIITCRLVLDIRTHMHTGSDVTHGPHVLTALPIEHRKWATQRRTVDGGGR